MGGQGAQLSPVEMRGNIMNMLSKIKDRKQSLDDNMDGFARDAQETKMQVLQNFFGILQKNGIDPSNQMEVRALFEKVYAESPEMYEMIVPIINELLGDEEEAQEEMPMQEMSQNLMDRG